MVDDFYSRALTCDRVNCGALAGWLPQLMVRADYRFRNSTPAPAILSLAYCQDCKAAATVADFLSDQGWSQIEEAFASIGRAPPERERTTLVWRSISDPEPYFQMMVGRVRERQAQP